MDSSRAEMEIARLESAFETEGSTEALETLLRAFLRSASLTRDPRRLGYVVELIERIRTTETTTAR